MTWYPKSHREADLYILQKFLIMIVWTGVIPLVTSFGLIWLFERFFL